jgi:hypothetical protein
VYPCFTESTDSPSCFTPVGSCCRNDACKSLVLKCVCICFRMLWFVLCYMLTALFIAAVIQIRNVCSNTKLRNEELHD